MVMPWASPLLPFAASLSTPEQKGRVIGTLMTGLTVGILLSRTVSGFVGEQFGWRAVFAMSALLTIAFAVLLQLFLSTNKPANSMSYSKLIGSMFTLHVSEAPFGYDAQQAGMFGIIVLAGVSGAKLSGFYGDSLVGLIAGIILIYFGVFSAQVSNQVRVFSIDPGAQSLINGIYMLGYYIGGAFGSLAGVQAFAYYGWAGVPVLSLLLVSASLLENNMKSRREEFSAVLTAQN